MSEMLIKQETLTDIANAIRAKRGTTELIPVVSLANEIESIENSNKVRLFVGDQMTPYDITEADLQGLTSIGMFACSYKAGLRSIELPNTIIAIGGYAFLGCAGMERITVPDSVTSIGEYAFGNCQIAEVNGTDNWAEIDFENADANPLSRSEGLYIGGVLVTDLDIKNGITRVGKYAFYKYNKLMSLTIPDSVTSIGNFAFYECSGLTSVEMGNGLTTIGDYAFWGCSGLTNVTIPDGVTSIDSYAFSNCSNLIYVTIGNAVESIGGYVFPRYNGNSITIKMKTTTPPVIDTTTFDISTINRIIVPEGTIESYQTATNWSEFANIMVEAKA